MNYKLIKPSNSKNYAVRWEVDGKTRQRSTGKSRKREAERLALSIIESCSNTIDADWSDFVIAYKRDHMDQQSIGYVSVLETSFRHIEAIIKPRSANDITPRTLAKFRTELKAQGLANSTITTYLKHLRGAFNWAFRHGYMDKSVLVEMPRDTKGPAMKGRPITGEEFERMLLATDSVLKQDKPRIEMRKLLNGLWFSGLRLGESLELSWSDYDQPVISGIDGRRPMIEMPASFDKARKSRTLPLTPDFVEFLRKIPKHDRFGYVFNVISDKGNTVRTRDRVGRMISEIGKASGVIVKKSCHPTAHDLRRSFASRWSTKVLPPVLQELMRHADIKTTLEYYVGHSAERTANEVWRAFEQSGGDTLGDTSEKPAADRKASNLRKT